ncbi:VanW family protein [candidate division WWE3 bacterium]|nr:VanW family protein [candidate division WWE3 bacterium]
MRKKLTAYLKRIIRQLPFDKLLLAVGAFALITSAYHLYYADRVIPGVRVGNVDVGGMGYREAVEALSGLNYDAGDIYLTYGSFRYVISPGAVYLKYDLMANVIRAFEVGRTGNVVVDAKDKMAGLIKPLKVKAIYDFDDEALENILSTIRGEINEEGRNADFVLEDGALTVTESSDGVKIDDRRLYGEVIGAFDFLKADDIEIPVDKQEAWLEKTELESIRNDIEEIVFSPLTVLDGEKKWDLTAQQKLDFLSFGMRDGRANFGFDKRAFEAYLDVLDDQIDKLPRGEVTSTDGTRVTGFKIIKEGRRLDVKKFTDDFRKAFFDGAPTVNVTANAYGALVSAGNYGIFALLGEGKSKFTGSIPARIHNLTLAAGRTSGVLVPPGEFYSFNSSVGEISGAAGYDAAYIIANGRTVLGEGGGVCQTSTTLFRAILNAGLPIVVRHPHAYRVSYYELDQPVGFDASVYQPSLDLQFRNDTPNHVLVQASWDLGEQSLTFKIYGTPDGRTVKISEPVISNVSPPPAPLYIKDKSLFKGTIRQVDFSAWGTDVSFTRMVERGGKALSEDTFSSRYQPWRAVYQVGDR